MKRMAHLAMLVCTVVIGASLGSVAQEIDAKQESQTTIKLISGEVLIGKVAGKTTESVNLLTSYGVLRIPVSDLSPESRIALGLTPADETTLLREQIAELKALVESLRIENRELRRAAQTGATAKVDPNPAGGEQAEEGVTYRMSSTGKRHNSRCRYYNSTGRDCGANEGIPCKICGG